MQAAQQLDQRPLVLRREFQQLMQTDRIIVDIHPGYGSSTALRHTVWAVMQQSLTDAVYVDFTHPQFQGRELNLPQWVVMTLCLPESNITAEARMVLEEEVRRALADGWLKPYFDHADALPLSQLSELFDLLLQLPKWAVACDRKYTPPEIDFRRPPIERALFGTPNTSEMQAFVDACVSERQRPAARRMLRECLWLQSTWLGLSVLRTMLQEGHPNRSAVAERYVLQLAERNACQHPPQELLFGLGQLTLECLFWVEKQEQMVKTITIDQIPRRGDYPFLFGRRYLPDLVTDWTRIGIASFHADKSLLSFPYWDLIVTMAGMAYAEKYVARQISLNETPQRVWSLCLPSAVRHLENHRQFKSLDRLMKEMETICWFDRGQHKAKRLTHLQWYAMDCVAALTTKTRARYNQFVAQLTDILGHEIETRIHELGGVLARFVTDVEASRVELDMLIDRLTSLDPRKVIAIGQSLLVAHEGKKASVITEIAGRMVSPPRRRG